MTYYKPLLQTKKAIYNRTSMRALRQRRQEQGVCGVCGKKKEDLKFKNCIGCRKGNGVATHLYRKTARYRELSHKSRKNWQLQNKYGISLDKYLELLEGQNGVCAICKTAPEPQGKTQILKDLAVDHDHVTNTNRGLLCDRCNRGIGHFKDNAALLIAAALYLSQWCGKIT